MALKKGGGMHLQQYDENTGRYSNENVEKSVNEDFENLQLVHKAGLDYNVLKFPFPIRDIHPIEYTEKFVEYIAKNGLYEYGYIDDPKISKYLFVYHKDRDKSKFVMEILGYSNNEEGWDALKNDIIIGTDFSKMVAAGYTKDHIKVKVESIVHNTEGKSYKIITVWELKNDFTIRFITIVPGGK